MAVTVGSSYLTGSIKDQVDKQEGNEFLKGLVSKIDTVSEALDLTDNINWRDPLGWSTLRQRFDEDRLGREWWNSQLSELNDAYKLLPEKTRTTINTNLLKGAQSLGTAWEGAKTIDNPRDFFEYPAWLTAHGIELIGKPFEFVADQIIHKGLGVDKGLANAVEMLIPYGTGAALVARRMRYLSTLKKGETATEALRRAVQAGDEATIKRILEAGENTLVKPESKAALEPILAKLEYDPPSSTLDELDLLKSQPFFQNADAAEQTRLIRELPLVTQDMINPNLSTGFRLPLAVTATAGGRKLLSNSSVMQYTEFRRVSSQLSNKGRDWLQIYETPRLSNVGTTFGLERTRQLPLLRQEFRELLELHPTLTPNSGVQIHHIAGLKATMGIYDGLQKGSPLYWDVTNRLMEHIPGLGDARSNLLGVVGSSRTAGTPHGLVHAFYREIIGEAGELFFTPEVLSRMRYDRTFRLQKADELGRIIKESERIVVEAQRIITASGRTDISINDVIEKISIRDFQRMIELRQQPAVDTLVRNAIQAEALAWYNRTDPNMLKDQNLDKLRDAAKAVSREIVDVSIRSDDLPDSVSTQHLYRLEAYLERLREQSIEIEELIKKLTYD